MSSITAGDLERALSILPEPRFRNADIYDVAEELGLKRWQGQSLWYQLLKRGWIVRTGDRIANARRRFYWERVKR